MRETELSRRCESGDAAVRGVKYRRDKPLGLAGEGEPARGAGSMEDTLAATALIAYDYYGPTGRVTRGLVVAEGNIQWPSEGMPAMSVPAAGALLV